MNINNNKRQSGIWVAAYIKCISHNWIKSVLYETVWTSLKKYFLSLGPSSQCHLLRPIHLPFLLLRLNVFRVRPCRWWALRVTGVSTSLTLTTLTMTTTLQSVPSLWRSPTTRTCSTGRLGTIRTNRQCDQIFFEVFFSIWVNFEPTLANFLCFCCAKFSLLNETIPVATYLCGPLLHHVCYLKHRSYTYLCDAQNLC